jgi:hypothetical protein
MRFGRAFLAAAYLGIFSPVMAYAADADFSHCDGYFIPNLKGFDGMMSINGFLGGKSSTDLRKSDISLSKENIDACDKALADPRILADYWMRRAHLLQAKALHQIAAGDAASALLSLDQSDAVGAGRNNIHFDNSIKLGNRAVRAFALTELGKGEEAKKEALLLSSARPYSSQILELALSSVAKADTSLATYTQLQKEITPISPSNIIRGFWDSFLAGKFADAAALGPQISFDLPKLSGGWRIDAESGREYTLIDERAKLAGAIAYAQQALGQDANADATIAAAKVDLENAASPPPEPAPGKKLSRSVQEDYNKRKSGAEQGKFDLVPWEKAVALRRKAASINVDEAIAEIGESSPTLQLPILGDLYGAFKIRDPQEKIAQANAIKNWYDEIYKARVKELSWPIDELHKALPRPEFERMRPKFKKFSELGLLWNGNDTGLSRKEDKEAGTWTIRFTHNVAPGPMVEELALLGAAISARDAGKDSLLLLSRRTMQRTTTIVGYYGGGSEQNSGYEAQLLVAYVNARSLPQQYKDASWRLIPVASVISALKDQYPAGDSKINK